MRLRNILESNVGEKYYLSEEKTTKLITHLNAQDAPTSIAISGGGREPKIAEPKQAVIASGNDISHTLLSRYEAGPRVDAKMNTVIKEPRAVLTPDRTEKRQNGRRFKDPDEPMFTLTAQDRHGILSGYRIRKLTPRECGRLQGFPEWAIDAILDTVSNSQAYKQFGNAVTVNVIYALAERLAPYIKIGQAGDDLW